MNYIVCLKWGKKYSAEYVNKLYYMTQRHCKVPHEFVCFTDDLRDINPKIKTINTFRLILRIVVPSILNIRQF